MNVLDQPGRACEKDTYRIWAPGGLATALVAEREETERVGASESDCAEMMKKKVLERKRE
jgi:hypothetical protein